MLDKTIDAALLKIHTPFLNQLMNIVTNIGNKITIVILTIAIVLFLIYKKEYVKNKMFVLAMALGGIGMEILKYLIKKPRPITMTIPETGYGFPSGHATISMILFGMLIVMFKDKIKNKTNRIIFISINVFLILAVGFSRLYFNVHYPTDVLGGYTLGLIAIFFSEYLTKKLKFMKKKKLFW